MENHCGSNLSTITGPVAAITSLRFALVRFSAVIISAIYNWYNVYNVMQSHGKNPKQF